MPFCSIHTTGFLQHPLRVFTSTPASVKAEEYCLRHIWSMEGYLAPTVWQWCPLSVACGGFVAPLPKVDHTKRNRQGVQTFNSWVWLVDARYGVVEKWFTYHHKRCSLCSRQTSLYQPTSLFGRSTTCLYVPSSACTTVWLATTTK